MPERGKWGCVARLLMAMAVLEAGALVAGVSAGAVGLLLNLQGGLNLPGYSARVSTGDCLWQSGGCGFGVAGDVRGVQVMVNKVDSSGTEELWLNRGVLWVNGCVVVIDVEPVGGGKYVNKNWSSCGR